MSARSPWRTSPSSVSADGDPVHPEHRGDVLAVRAVVHGLEEDAVEPDVDEAGRRGIRCAVARRVQVADEVRDAELRAGPALAERGEREPVREQQVVRGARGLGVVGVARRLHAPRVAEERRAHRLVDRDPVLGEVAERVGHERRVLAEAVRRLAGGPAALVLERLRQVPVVERHVRLDAAGAAALEQRAVERDALGVELAAAGRLQARPRERQPVGRDAELGHEVEVVRPAVVVVDGDVAGLAVEDPAGLAHERVPDARAAAALGDGALDLVGGGGDAPREVRGKVEAAHGRAVGRGIRHVMVLRRVVGDGRLGRRSGGLGLGRRRRPRRRAARRSGWRRSMRRTSWRSGSGTGAAMKSRCVYGCSGWAVTWSPEPVSTISPWYMTATRWLMWRTTARSCEMNR